MRAVGIRRRTRGWSASTTRARRSNSRGRTRSGISNGTARNGRISPRRFFRERILGAGQRLRTERALSRRQVEDVVRGGSQSGRLPGAGLCGESERAHGLVGSPDGVRAGRKSFRFLRGSRARRRIRRGVRAGERRQGRSAEDRTVVVPRGGAFAHISQWSEAVRISGAGPWKPVLVYSDTDPKKMLVFHDNTYPNTSGVGMPMHFTIDCLEVERPG